jgi:hypothetical protein
LKKLDHLRELWRTLLPHIPEPQPGDAMQWAQFSLSIAEKAILRSAKKFRKERIDGAVIDPALVFRYTTATARHLSEDIAARQKGDSR